MQGIFRLARHVALAAFVARALVPVGWMPGAQGLIICPGDTMVQHAQIDMPMDHSESAMQMDRGDMDMPMDHDGHGKAPAQSDHHDFCPRAAAAHLASGPDAPQLTLPSFHAFAAFTDRSYAAVIAARFTPQSPRAPPLNA